MIAATLKSGLVVEAESSLFGAAQIKSFGGRAISSAYSGGRGYVAVSWNSVPLCELAEVTQIEYPDECDELANWLAAIEDTDRLADEHSPCTSAALEIEDAAREVFARFIHEHSIARGTHSAEITPKDPPIPAFQFWEGDYAENLYRSGMALQGSRSA